MLQACRYFAERNQATMFPCCSMPGVTSPVTLSGTVICNNAENLAGIVYAQLVRPGAPVVYSNTSGGTDMRFVTPAIGSPETALISFASASLAKYYNIPCRTGGSLADSKCVDWQCGVESTFTMMAALMSSASFVLHSCGVMDSFNVLCYEKYLLDEQNIEMIRKLVNGMSVHTDSEELENLSDVGPGGQFIGEEHTMDYMKDELYTPALFNKMSFTGWEDAGKKTLFSLQTKPLINVLLPLNIRKSPKNRKPCFVIISEISMMKSKNTEKKTEKESSVRAVPSLSLNILFHKSFFLPEEVSFYIPSL